ncbi:MAG: response regulator transcription factor [Rhodocyclaceae bacterium]|jgi:DNA-binding response OmpR family regulator|uniref:response regulator n=1 Tax=Fluviibacter phosphoraccumulans TaxID=1751046 RepID=UPI0010B3ABB3|nr:response regulator transcription factor [Fluviibacter phosphoraccumulans]MBP7917994.1 response regulator transcription factor [Rhodocyclaceae bacterium]BCA66379.1 DNA-binding response regulator [Fluviibacter phosphoraccumulans]
MHILIVEDDLMLGEGLQVGLRQAGFQPEWVKDGEAAWQTLRHESFSAVVLDLGLPKMDGLEVLKRVRAHEQKMPVLVLTARDTAKDVIAGLDTGADDYMVKPCDLGELAARLRALIRRAAGAAAPIMQIGALSLDPASREVRYENNVVELSPREFDLLHELMLNAGKVLTRAQLESKIYPWGEEVESNALEVHVHHLRRKTATEVIKTVRGVGYLMPK